MVGEITIDRLVAGGLLGLEELSSTWLLLHRARRKHQMVVKDDVWSKRQCSPPLLDSHGFDFHLVTPELP